VKRCTKCGKEKPLDAFYRHYGQPTSLCRLCIKATNQAWRERNKERHTRYQVTYNRARKLGLTYDEYQALDEDPGKECAICGATSDSLRNGTFNNGTVTAGQKRLAIDHSHTTGRLRGFLCGHCNRALGLANDDPALLRKMADYLERGAEFPVLGSYEARPVISRPVQGRGGPRTSRLTPCTVESCNKNARTRSLCGMHYARLTKHGITDDPARIEVCTVEGCVRPHRTKGYCILHYKRFTRLGDPVAGWIPPEQAATNCATCGQELKSYRTIQRFCSAKCRNAWHTTHPKAPTV